MSRGSLSPFFLFLFSPFSSGSVGLFFFIFLATLSPARVWCDNIVTATVEWKGASSVITPNGPFGYCGSGGNCNVDTPAQPYYACGYQNTTDYVEYGEFNGGWGSFVNPVPDNARITRIDYSVTANFLCSNHSSTYLLFLGPVFNGTAEEDSFIDSIPVLQSNPLNAAIGGGDTMCCGKCMYTVSVANPGIVGLQYNYNENAVNWVALLPALAVEDSSSDEEETMKIAKRSIEMKRWRSPDAREVVRRGTDDDDDMKTWALCLHSVQLRFTYDYDDTQQHIKFYIMLGGAGLFVLLALLLVILAAVFVARRQIRRSKKKRDESLSSIISSTASGFDLVGVEESAIKDIRIVSKLGRGSFGDVFKGESRTLGTVAVKVLPVEMQDVEKSRALFEREVTLMTHLRHPNIMLFVGACLNPPNMCFVMEYMSNGSLFDVIHNKSVDLKWDVVRDLLLDAARGMNYLHNCSPPVVHRDLKSHNLLIDQHWRCKVADFGLSRVVEKDKLEQTLTAVGTPCWSAPEVLRHEKYTPRADVYSFAVVMWEVATRRHPYDGMTPYQVCVAVATKHLRPELTAEMERHIPLEYLRLMRDCWAEQALDRPSFEQVISRLEEMEFGDEHVKPAEMNVNIHGLSRSDFAVSGASEERYASSDSFAGEENSPLLSARRGIN